MVSIRRPGSKDLDTYVVKSPKVTVLLLSVHLLWQAMPHQYPIPVTDLPDQLMPPDSPSVYSDL